MQLAKPFKSPGFKVQKDNAINHKLQCFAKSQTSFRSVGRWLPMLLLILLSNLVSAQAWTCGTTDNSSNSSQAAAGTSVCNPILLNDLKQGIADRQIEINVNVQIFAPSSNSNSSVWLNTAYTPSTYTAAVKLINDANIFLSNMPSAPSLYGVTSYTNSNIKLVLKGYYVNIDDIGYGSINNTTQMHYYDDPTAINIFFGNNESSFNSIYVSVIPALYPDNMIRFHPGVNFSGSTSWDNISFYGKTLAHEMGHILGLNHTTGQLNSSYAGEPYSFITPSFGCCNKESCSDYVRETHLAFEGCGTPGGSNNLMSQNAGCNEYLSPHQMAVMHYNLRTGMKQFLTASGYTAALTVNNALDYNVTTDEYWTTDRYFGGNITVKQGKTLTIECGVAMTKGAKILVEPGAQLFLDGGKVTNISGELWDGVEVSGVASQPQTMYNPLYYYNTPGLALYQGEVRLHGGELSNATTAIRTYTTSSSGMNWNSTGGIVICYSANFINNVKDVEFMPYNSNSFVSNVSKFINCNFKTTAELNTGVQVYEHVSLYMVNGVQFKGCLFENSYADVNFYNTLPSSTPYFPGMGIHSADASYIVDQQGTNPSIFRGLETGVRVDNSNPLKNVTVKNSRFYDCVSDGVYFKNMNNFTFEKNYVSPPYFFAGTGMYLNNCANYSVKTCTFIENTTQNYKLSVGIYAYNSKKGSHQIYNNSFSNFEQGISAIGDNSGYTNLTDGLKMNCNDFTQVTNKYDIAMYPYNQFATVKQIQGKTAFITSVYDLVRNRYAAPSTCNSCENKWFISGTSYRTIDHGTNSSTNAKPIPQPQYSDVALNVVAAGGNFQTSDCTENPGVGGGKNPTGPKLETINTYLAALKESHNGDNDLSFDIQATLGEKIAYFMSDTLDANADSVIAIIEGHADFIKDADVLRVYAYMQKGDYETANTLAEGLGEGRENMTNLLKAQINLEQADGKLYSLADSETINLLNSLAENDTLDGYSASQSILMLALSNVYSEPRLHPEGGSERTSNNNSAIGTIAANQLTGEKIRVYPNPAQANITVYVSSSETKDVKIELRDLLGRIIYTNFISTNIEQQVPLKTLNNGVYFLTVKNSKEQAMYQTKIVKQD